MHPQIKRIYYSASVDVKFVQLRRNLIFESEEYPIESIC